MSPGTGTVTLTPLTKAHLEQAALVWSDPAVIRYTNVERPLDRAGAAEKLRRLLESQRGLPEPVIFAVLLDGDFCGLAGCPPVDAERERFGLFFQLLPACWGRGVGRTAAALTLTSLRRSFPAAQVLADAAAENTASIRILEGLGFCRTAVHPGALRRSGESWDVWDYRLRCGG